MAVWGLSYSPNVRGLLCGILFWQQALFFPEFWPQVANDSAQDWRQLLADEATARMQIERRIDNGEIAQVVLRAPNVLNP